MYISIQMFAEVLFYFAIYSFLGWVLENVYNYVTAGKFLKPNFFFGPFKPMYGLAPVILVYSIGANTHWTVTIFLCFFIPTVVEYVSGFLLEKLTYRKWWDYSNLPLQIHGHICLSFSICWILLSIVCVKLVHPGIAAMYEVVGQYWFFIWPTMGLYFLAEMVLAIRRHSSKDLRILKQSNPINK